MNMRRWRAIAAYSAAALPIATAALPAWARDGDAACAARQVAERIASTGLDPDGSAQARWRQDDRCRRDFQVELEDVPVRRYELLVGGVVRGVISVAVDASGRTRGEIEFEAAGDDTPHARPLDFAPIGAVLEIRAAGDIYFADVFDGIAGAATPVPTRTAVPTGGRGDATPTAAATRTAPPTRRGEIRTPTRAATRTRTIRPTTTATVPRALRTATPARTGGTGALDRLGWFGWGKR